MRRDQDGAVYEAKESDLGDTERDGAQDKKLSPGEIQQLEDAGYDVHDLKGNQKTGQTDLYNPGRRCCRKRQRR